MKKTLNRILALVLTIVMTVTAVPFTGINAKAYGVNGYCATAAAQWAIDHWQDVDSPLYGKGYWFDGGDCANFVSQCIYMGGIDQSAAWNHNGYYAHFGTNSGGSFIRAQQLYDYVVSIGGQSVQNPSASQVSVGDLIFFRREGSYRLTHSTIVTAVENGVPRIAFHSVYENGGYTKDNTKNWTLGYAGKNIYLVKMNGSLCTAQKTRNFDVYTVKSGGANLYSGTSTSSGRVSTFLDGEYAHVYSTTSANGYTWGYTFRYGKWGWVQLNRLNYQRHISSAVPTHLMGDWYVTKPSTCVTNGTEQRDCQRCTYYETRVITGGHVVNVHANCLEPGYCSLCGVKTENPLGHSFGAWNNIKNPTCTETGTCKHSCVRCGYSETETVAALGHDDAYTATAPTCTANGTATYKCNRCGRQTINYINANNTVSDWTTQVIPGLAPLETKTQYRYKTKSTTTSYDTSMSGWTQNGGSWVQSSTGSVKYVSSWPSGFDRNHSLYGTYNKTPPSASETATTKTVINSNNHTGYIYWHYCRNNQSLNLNYPDRLVNDVKTSEFSGFHAYYSTTNYTQYDGSGNVVNAASSGTCKDTQWYYKLNVYTCSYTNYNKLFNYYKWSDWSGWQDASVSANSDRQVETRTLYKYNLAKMGHDFSVEGAREDATCTEPGYIGMKCSRCGAFSPDSIVIPAKGHELYNENSSRGWYVTNSTAAATEYRRDCQRFCGYFEQKTTNNACVWQKTGETAATCEKNGKITYTCSLHGETKTETITAPGHKEDNNWILVDAASCANGGKDGKEICYCVRHDNGKTCSKIFERIIPAPDHVEVIDNSVASTCTQTGLTEGSHCNVCKEVIKEQKSVDALGHDDSGEWVRIVEPDCGVTGVEHLYCVRECANGEKCGFLIDIRYIDGLEPKYVEKERKESTCIDIGWVKYTCELCEGTDHEHGYTEFLELVDHIWSEYDVTDAVCIYPGEKTRSCTVCGLEDEPVIIPAEREEHDFIETTIPSTCVSGGISTKICSICEFEEEVDDPDPLGHNMKLSEERSYAPTCEEPGCNIFECIREGCDYEYSETINATGHNYQPAEEHPATCIDAAYVIMVCQNDNSHVYEKYTTDPLGHDMGEWYTITVPTCSAQGLAQRDCQRDYCTYNEQKVLLVNPDAHDWGDWFVDADPNCVDKGIEKRICNINNEHIQTKETVTDPDNHDMGEWYEVTKATCTEKGLEKRDCNRCDYSEERETAIDPDNHYAETFYTVDEKADCENDGSKSHHCERCDKSLNEVVISKRNHVYDNGVETKAPTCTEDGVKTFTCTNSETEEYNACTHSYTEVIPATDHDWGNWETETPATCETEGLEKRICKNDASHVEENVLTAIGHKWDDGVIDPDSTCKVHGTKTYTCQNDASHIKTEEVPLDENNHVGDTYTNDAKKPDCTNDGYTGDIYCSDCDKKLESGEVIPALGHNMGEWYEATKATCTEKGLEKRDCNRCDYSEERETAIDPDNHYAETFYTVDEKADCENDGKKSHHCERCDKSLDEVVISKRNHVYDNGVETKAPTCTEEGIKTFTCTNAETEEYNACTHSYTEVIPATGHDWGGWKTIPGKEPTIYQKGKEHRICKNDSSHIQERDVDMLESRVAYFIVADENGDFVYEGKKYTLVDTVRFALGTTVIINPDVPEAEGYYGYWEDYTIADEDLYIEAKYELKSSDNQSDLVSDKSVVYKDGVATITLSAFAETLNAKVPMGATPYDIVLVLDQSSSMEKEFGSDKTASNYNNSRIKVLKDVALSFIDTVYESSVEYDVDHRMAIVGFSGTQYSYQNTGLLTPSGKVKTFGKLTDKDYAEAFVDVREQKSILDSSINNMEIKTGTAADYGMQMARQVLANNRNSDREKLVLFITDGEPADVQGRNYWAFSKPIANDTIDYANQIKQEYDATIYSVGVAAGADPDDETKDLNIYLHNVSSNYPDAKSMTEKGKSSPMKNYFLTAEDKDAVSKAFESIVAQKITNTISFTKVNFYDTISEYFTLTTENENALRQSVKEKYGVTDSDIIITRNADGTTTVRINNLIPKPVFDENNVQSGYGVTVDFDVTANEKTLDGGTFLTNNENAGIEHDGKTVIDFKIPEGEVISSGRAIVEFRIGDEVYAIREVNIGDNVIVPETDVADWIITEGATITSDYTVFNAEYTTETNTVEWIIGDEKITQTYHTGEIIRIPEIDVPENKIFTGWSTAVPYRMPAYDLSFIAVFESHAHNFTGYDKNGDCASGIVHTYTCDCGYSYSEHDAPSKHSYTANVHLVNNESVATMTCAVCGAAESSVINYKAQYSQFNSTKVVDLTLHDNEGISVQPDGYIYIKISEEQKVLSNAKTGKLVVTRVNEDNSTDNIPYLKNSSADSIGYYVEGSYIILKLDHFSYYAMTIPEEDAEIPSFGEIECSFNGHNYESVITAPTCTTEGYTTHTCISCGDVYTDAETGITDHVYENNICLHCGDVKEINCSHACHKNGFIGFIWKIFNFIFRIFGIESERFCECGIAHW